LGAPSQFPQGLTAPTIARAYWNAACLQAAVNPKPENWASHTLHQTLRLLGADIGTLLKGKKPGKGVQAQLALELQAQQLRQAFPNLIGVERLCAQLGRVLAHPLFSNLEPAHIRQVTQMLKAIVANSYHSKAQLPDQPFTEAQIGKWKKLEMEAQLAPVSNHLEQMERQLKQMALPPAQKVMETLHSSYDETDAIAISNAGLVILWPFLPRFFENLGLVSERKFESGAAQHQAAQILQYIVTEAEENHFEGLLPLNKLLCGIGLEEPFSQTTLGPWEKEMAEGLMQAVIDKGPYWKNLSLDGFRTSYLQREGLLRHREGVWILQVKKETHDITLNKLPWQFTTVKLPWMNQILMIEWS
jgi:hypothetical protein